MDVTDQNKNSESEVTSFPEPAEPSRVLLHMPVDVRSLSMGVLAAIAVLWLLHWAKDVFIPIMLGIMFSYALSPVVDRMARWRLPRSLSAAVLLLALAGGIGGGVWGLSDDANDLIKTLPEAAQKLRQVMRSKITNQESAIDKVQKAAAELERAARESSGAPAPTLGVQRVTIEQARFDVKTYLWTGTMGLMQLLGQTAMVFLITFFLLASGDTFRRKMAHIAGPTFARRKITVQALDEITEQIQRYLLVNLFTSALVGVVSWICYVWIGLEHAAVWGVVAGVLNLVPYVGSLAVTAGTALVGFMQFGTIEMAGAVAAISLVINSIEGYLVTPYLTSRASRMNPVVIFIGVLVWGWLWGVWGLLLGIPIMMVVKAICDRVDDLKPIGELLGT
ncbi:MAG: AI-2E family transporter [Burkholderiales bacterium]|nr:MAG: AI-2E family transporter [Burkholderiales bacterium]